MWIRNEFIMDIAAEKVVVFGHTETKSFMVVRIAEVYFGSNRIIGIDGGAVYGGQLNCLELPVKRLCSKKLKEIRGNLISFNFLLSKI